MGYRVGYYFVCALALVGTVCVFIAASGSGAAQQIAVIEPAGGGEPPDLPSDTITDDHRAAIQKEISGNIAHLEAEGLLAPAVPQFVALSWPVRKAPGLPDFSVDAISNYVDHNVGFPGLLLDWNCGVRTYDQSSGYNHKGIDIFTYPFTWKKMDNDQAEIVAAADGIIIAKHDGNFDRSCGFNSNFWNAVYVRHADGSIAWYGHMKNGSLTAKPVGATVSVGEKLGVIGSSGNSTGPHLHFELYDANGKLQDPFQGPCNLMNPFTWWSDQEPYRVPRINRLMTQSAGPVFNGCPNQETTNEKTVFRPGQALITAAYYRDQAVGQQTVFSIFRPDGTAFANWAHISPNNYTVSYWYWNWTVPPNPQNGTWKFRAVFNSELYEQEFLVDTSATVSGQILDPSGRGLRNAVVSIISPQNVTRSAIATDLGYYSIENVPIGGAYEIRVASRRYRFEPRLVNISDNVADLNFTGIE